MFEKLTTKKIAVFGDFFLDRYVIGSARRISPEAPIPVVEVKEIKELAGGAGNVVSNLLSLGSCVLAVGRVGSNSSGKKLKSMLTNEGAETSYLLEDESFSTGMKERVIAAGQQIVRVDHETLTPLSLELEGRLIAQIPMLLEEVSAVAVSDYGKGFLSRNLLQALYRECKKRQIPTITDPKGKDFTKYAGTSLIKPNFGEALAVSDLEEKSSLEEVSARVLAASSAEELIITRSEQGISYFNSKKERFDFPVVARGVKDVTGAGDTVLAMLVFAAANRLTYQEGCRLANVAASFVLEKIGCASITLEELAGRYLEEESREKLFDGNHLYALKLALRGRAFTLLELGENAEISKELFAYLRTLKAEGSVLVVHLLEKNACSELSLLLSASKEVDYLIVSDKELDSLIEILKPSHSETYGREELKQSVSVGVSAKG